MFMARLRAGATIVFGILATGAGLMLPGTSPGRPKTPVNPAPAAEVVVVHPAKRTASESIDFSGRTTAAASAVVSSRITSPITKVVFQPGAKVKRGDVLFELDDRIQRADYAKAQAELVRAEGRLRHAEQDAAVFKQLVTAKATNQQELFQRQGAADEARANVMVVKAGLCGAAGTGCHADHFPDRWPNGPTPAQCRQPGRPDNAAGRCRENRSDLCRL